MSGPIKKGDLVMVVGVTKCCGSSRNAGIVGRVTDVYRARKSQCWCGHITEETLALLDNEKRGVAYRLKKIDPPATGEYDRVPVRKTEPMEVL